MSFPTSREFTSALLTKLANTSQAVGDGEAPANASALLAAGSPYIVLHSLPARAIDGPQSDINADGWLLYQVTSVGVDRIQAEWTREKCRTAILGATLPTATGRKVMGPINLEPQDVLRDDSVQPPVWMAVDYYTLATTPS